MLQKNCNNCACNKVCNHDEWGYENCGNWIFQSALDPDQQGKLYFPRLAAALTIGDNDTVAKMATEGTQRYFDLFTGVLTGRHDTDLIFAALAASAIIRTVEGEIPEQQWLIKKMLESSMMTIRVNPNAIRPKNEE